ncbi:MAG: hypothetical protein HYU80_01110 [Candidatus Blackburnbacteria bacterium]|nr:hypothetical protein [Candidatus Blackburnbacteria bacterium]
MGTINWSKLFKQYVGMWVALAEDEKTVVAASKNAKAAFDEARKAELKVPIMLKVPEESIPYIGAGSK